MYTISSPPRESSSSNVNLMARAEFGTFTSNVILQLNAAKSWAHLCTSVIFFTSVCSSRRSSCCTEACTFKSFLSPTSRKYIMSFTSYTIRRSSHSSLRAISSTSRTEYGADASAMSTKSRIAPVWTPSWPAPLPFDRGANSIGEAKTGGRNVFHLSSPGPGFNFSRKSSRERNSVITLLPAASPLRIPNHLSSKSSSTSPIRSFEEKSSLSIT
mmetsp:Transcript_9059/g.17748  ORF Transcript_9059/g.17748 Transcript_9059/m.17748 type:complete len:214 (-) Transcript_9059:1091-1732(-)